MAAMTYQHRRSEIETYFDRTASEAWARLTSDEPLGRIRATVRAGREQMRNNLLDRLPTDLAGRRVLDAGCGTGALAVEAARRGADVVAVDLSPTLIRLAQERAPRDLGQGSLEFRAADMTGDTFGRFDHVIAMDSLIHYDLADSLRLLGRLAAQAESSVLFTFAPRTPLLAAMHTVGRLFPRGERAPALVPVREAEIRTRIARDPALARWQVSWSERVASGFYTSQAMELRT